MSENMSGKCYKCQYRGKVFYSEHSTCNHPKPGDIGVKGDIYGRKSGWFNFPTDFEPVWLETCNGFKEIPTENTPKEETAE